MKLNHFFLFFALIGIILSPIIPNFSIAYAIEVSGHLTEDTTWSPDNNPYHVIDNLYVDSGVTLTILPGTEIKISAAPLTCVQDQEDYFWYQNGTNEAKMFWVDGKIIAEGTQQDSIIFTRMQDDFDYYWGCIYITEQADLSVFKHCRLEYSGSISIYVGLYAKGVISIYNGLGKINNCDILNNSAGVIVRYITREIEITNNKFINDNLNNYVFDLWHEIVTVGEPENGFHPCLIANNYFEINVDAIYPISSHFVDNEVVNALDNGVYLQGETGTSYFYDNLFQNCYTSIEGSNDFLYIKNNQFIGGYQGIDIDDAYAEICDNYFNECKITIYYSYSSKIINNIFNNNSSGSTVSGNISVISNNIIFNNDLALSGRGEDQFTNNIFINNDYIFSSVTDTHIIENQIFLYNEELYDNNLYGNPIFRNCILDFELPEECIDGGGNIWLDSLQAQSIFEDIQSGNFHLAPGSIAIDAGFDTLGYYYPFDMDYNYRVWDGDNNGTTIIDIGPYEYGAPSLGGIHGLTYNLETGETVDYVLVKIDNEPGEFTFSDSVGNYDIKLPAGVYDVYAERVFYDDAIEYEIEVIDGEFTNLNIPMFTTVNSENNEMIATQKITLTNYPNPFNPSTSIAFKIVNGSNIELSVFNLKGQKIKTLIYDYYQAGEYIKVWNGLNDENQKVTSGVYFINLIIDKQKPVVKKCLFLK